MHAVNLTLVRADDENDKKAGPVAPPMSEDKTFKLVELVGISDESFSDAVNNAVKKADDTLQGLSWIEVVEERGLVQDGVVAEYQVKVKVAFKVGANQ